MDGDFEDEAVTNALRSRRLPHGRSNQSKRGGRGGSSKTVFDPLRAIGKYQVTVGSGKGRGRSENEDASSNLSIHGLTANEDGFDASFAVGEVAGTAILAGSRKTLASIVKDLEKASCDSQERFSDHSDEQSELAHVDNASTEQDTSKTEDDMGSDSEEGGQEERINRRVKAFEKNSFRNPKFWLRWKGRITSQGEDVVEENTGYIVFTGNDCAKFEGTMTSSLLDWDNVKIKGHKVKPHVGPNLYKWQDFTLQ